MRKKAKAPEYNDEYLEFSAKLTPAQRLRWLEEAQEFVFKAIPKNVLRASLKLRAQAGY
jgi:hypothetical protein